MSRRTFSARGFSSNCGGESCSCSTDGNDNDGGSSTSNAASLFERLKAVESGSSSSPSSQSGNAEGDESADKGGVLTSEAREYIIEISARLAEFEEQVFGEALLGAEELEQWLDSEPSREDIEKLIRTRVSALSGEILAEDDEDEGMTPGEFLEQIVGEQNAPTGNASDAIQGEPDAARTALSELQREENAQKPLGGEVKTGALATLEAEDDARDPLNGKTLPGALATFDAREKAERGSSNSLSTAGANYSGRGVGDIASNIGKSDEGDAAPRTPLNALDAEEK